MRGYQVRKHHKEICRAVGVLEKAVLRWRRKGAGLRGFRPETDTIEESEDEDILKVFRKEKVDGAINQAISRVLSMVKSPKARQQYHRVHEKYCQAKVSEPHLLIYIDPKDLYIMSCSENSLFHVFGIISHR